jgi:putative SOS response-associated peptidase YedK
MRIKANRQSHQQARLLIFCKSLFRRKTMSAFQLRDRHPTMCGRVDVHDSRVHNYPPRWNFAPSQELLVIRRNRQTGEVSLDPLRWGLFPIGAERRTQPDQRQMRDGGKAADMPNEPVAEIYDRMPLILAPGDSVRWLSEELDPRDLMRPFLTAPMRMWPISTRVNKPENDDPLLLEPSHL